MFRLDTYGNLVADECITGLLAWHVEQTIPFARRESCELVDEQTIANLTIAARGSNSIKGTSPPALVPRLCMHISSLHASSVMCLRRTIWQLKAPFDESLHAWSAR